MRCRVLFCLVGAAVAAGALAQEPSHIGPGPGSAPIARQPGCPSGGNVLVSTPPDQVFLYVSDMHFPQVFAVEVTLNTAETLGEVVFFGGYATANSPPGNETFRVLVRQDGGNVPGAIITDEAGIVPSVFQPTGVTVFDITEIEVVLPLAHVPLDAGTYWIEIFGETFDPDDYWHWETGSPVDANQSPGSAFAFDVPGDLWLPLGDRTLSITVCDDVIPVGLEKFEIE